MGKIEEVEAERKMWESEEAWELRKAFLLAHYDEYPKMRLQCLSQLFINVTVLGCEYSPSLMETIRELGAGIQVKEKKNDERAFVKASQAKKRERVRLSDLDGIQGNSAPVCAVPGKAGMSREEFLAVRQVEDQARMKDLKVFIGQTGHHLSGPQMLSNATTRCRSSWRLNEEGTLISIVIDQFVVFRHRFSESCANAVSCAVNAVIETFLTCEPTVSDGELKFDGHGADECYINSVNRSLKKVRPAIAKEKGYKGLCKSLESVNINVTQEVVHLEGWSQRVTMRADDVFLASEVLSKADCTRPRMTTIMDDISTKLCQAIGAGAQAVVNTSPELSASLVISKTPV